MTIPPGVRAFWDAFAATQPADPTPRFLEAFHFTDNEAGANELAKLVLAGRKRATASLAWSYEVEKKRMPGAGDLSVVTDWAGTPLCVIETTRVDLVPFDEVSAEFAATEGEGDGSLRYWREGHEAFFSRECRRLGRTPDARMLVVCERFDVIHKPAKP